MYASVCGRSFRESWDYGLVRGHDDDDTPMAGACVGSSAYWRRLCYWLAGWLARENCIICVSLPFPESSRPVESGERALYVEDLERVLLVRAPPVGTELGEYHRARLRVCGR